MVIKTLDLWKFDSTFLFLQSLLVGHHNIANYMEMLIEDCHLYNIVSELDVIQFINCLTNIHEIISCQELKFLKLFYASHLIKQHILNYQILAETT